jgi:uncharacterized protein (DUF2235 family)
MTERENKASDFEVHAIGTATELRLSRELAKQMKQVGEQFGFGLFPENVSAAYHKLIAHYNNHMNDERYTNGI